VICELQKYCRETQIHPSAGQNKLSLKDTLDLLIISFIFQIQLHLHLFALEGHSYQMTFTGGKKDG
jgi:hypothetical protein